MHVTVRLMFMSHSCNMLVHSCKYPNPYIYISKLILLFIICGEKLLLFHVFTFIPKTCWWLQSFLVLTCKNFPKILCGCEVIYKKCGSLSAWRISNVQYNMYVTCTRFWLRLILIFVANMSVHMQYLIIVWWTWYLAWQVSNDRLLLLALQYICTLPWWYEIFYLLPITIISHQIYHDVYLTHNLCEW